jgi:hypothetical protein
VSSTTDRDKLRRDMNGCQTDKRHRGTESGDGVWCVVCDAMFFVMRKLLGVLASDSVPNAQSSGLLSNHSLRPPPQTHSSIFIT